MERTFTKRIRKMFKKSFITSVLMIAIIVIAILLVMFSFFITDVRAQEPVKISQGTVKRVLPTAEDYVAFMEYWLIFIQTIGQASQKEKIEMIYPKAIRELEDFIKRNPDSRWAIEAKMRIAEIHQLSSIVMFPDDPATIKLNKNWRVEANRWLLDIVENHPDYLYFNAVKGTDTGKSAAAWALYHLGVWNNNPAYLRQLLSKYPDSEEARSIIKDFNTINNVLKERNFFEKLTKEIKLGRDELAKIELKHSSKRIKCTEIRYRRDGSKTRHIYYDFAWKEIALKVMNLETHGVLIMKVKKVGQKVQSLQPEFSVTIEPRPSGVIWNSHNTAFKVIGVNDSQWAVILNKFPVRLKNGKRNDHIYSPYSSVLDRKIIIENGKKYIGDQIMFALFELGKLKAASDRNLEIIEKADGKLVTGAIERLALMEHSDYFEFAEFKAGRWPYNPFDRVLAVLALNGPEAYSSTGSPAQAIGLLQATNHWHGKKPGTWDLIREEYSWARLPSFEIGSANHRQSMKFAILLQDYNFKRLLEVFGQKIAGDPELEYYLAAAYNGGIGHVIKAIRDAQKSGTNWRKELAKLKKTNENLDYLDKLDYLLKNKY